MYICPITKRKLIKSGQAFKNPDYENLIYPIIGTRSNVVSFASAEVNPDENLVNNQMYDEEDSVIKYKNFLNWLFKTFKIDENLFRKSLVSNLDLKSGYKVLITGCGLGDDVDQIISIVGKEGVLCAQDLSKKMVLFSAENKCADNIYYSISNAENLPYEDNYFDAVFHFGGINLFANVGKAIAEMDRVASVGAKIVFGDEGIAPWLKSTEYGKAAINNNSLWGAKVPLELIPETATDVNLQWVLGNCFYLVSYTKNNNLPDIDMNIEHIGPRGGSMYKRFYGQLEGVDDLYKQFIDSQAIKNGVSKSKILEIIIDSYIHRND